MTVGNLRLAVLPLMAALSFGCTSSTPMIDTGPDAVVTFDGLHKVKGSRADEAWARPGLDLSGYSKIKLQSAGIEYRGRLAKRGAHGRLVPAAKRTKLPRARKSDCGQFSQKHFATN